MAIIYAETAKEGFSGLAMSFGSGMTNVALAINTIEGLSFSIARGGDWIDGGASRSIGSTQARICAIKEKGFVTVAKEVYDAVGGNLEALRKLIPEQEASKLIVALATTQNKKYLTSLEDVTTGT